MNSNERLTWIFFGGLIFGWLVGDEIDLRRQRKRIENLQQRLAAIEKAGITNATLIIKQDAQGNQIWNWSSTNK